ncbi:MAG: CBS domain-containing protein [Candidatus Aenigmatarchaeota archaeon]
MLPEIEEIPRRRKSLGLKQKDLARLAQVSQSFIAKLEAGKINPSYENVKVILDILERKENEKQPTAEEIMQKRIISVKSDDKIMKAINLMKKNGISQIPVMNNGSCVGSVSERSIVDYISEKHDLESVRDLDVEDLMADSFPQVPESTGLQTMTQLLRHNQAILVTRKGKVTGIVSKSDLLR